MSAPIPIDRKRKREVSFNDDFTDRWAGREFACTWSRTLRYVPERGHWRRWDGKRWVVALDVELDSIAKTTIDNWLVEALSEEDHDRKTALIDWARKSCSLPKLRAMIELAASEEIVWTLSEKFDAHPYLFNVANGTIDLRSGELRAHHEDDYLTRLSPVAYEPEAKAPRWVQFIDEVFDNRLDLVQFVQRAVGYTMTGHTSEQCFFLAYGRGANGKGRLLDALGRVFGEYATAAQIETFTTKRVNAAQASPDLAALAGARLVSAGEAEAGMRLSEGLVKSLTGDDPITCRNLHEGLFTYRPTLKLWMHVNHKPVIRGVDGGIWRRVRLVPFTVSFEGRADKQLDAKLAGEAVGILAWCVRGAVEWYRSGLGTAEAVSAATASYRDESDTLAPFIEARLEVDPKGEISRKRLTAVYQAWCEANGEEPLRPITLYRMLQDRAGVVPFKTEGERGFRGIKAKEKRA